ncbi:hypothetical protein HB364_26750 [Pseudoflavitalea sp. X16]|uniref:hypothetical protein n=1 Tax=Paraflavitalea devenefica TaxID=2716334 RepID=UPI001423EE28|nr:hypothetical protein [Paraflavitalea devenefica]NII28709.1 hypothetical protein [Paraflavitalea devenefica]
MDLKAAILEQHSKAQTDRIVQYVGHDKKRFNELMKVFLTGDALIQQRAGWPLSYCAQENPSFVLPHLEKLLTLLKNPRVHNAVTRNIVRLLQDIKIPERYQGPVMNTCFEFIASPTQPAAVKAFSLTILEHLADDYPDIIPELKLIIEEQWPHETAAFHSRARKILKKFG